jgi:hypothetical protein
MTRKQIHDVAVGCRKWFEEIWFKPGLSGKRYKLYAKCRGLVLGDRIELAIFHNNDQALQERAFGD